MEYSTTILVTVPLPSCQITNITNPTRKHKKVDHFIASQLPPSQPHLLIWPSTTVNLASPIQESAHLSSAASFQVPTRCTAAEEQQSSTRVATVQAYGVGILAPNSPNRHRQPASDCDRHRHSLRTRPMTAIADLF